MPEIGQTMLHKVVVAKNGQGRIKQQIIVHSSLRGINGEILVSNTWEKISAPFHFLLFTHSVVTCRGFLLRL
jgi:hypothetical protein